MEEDVLTVCHITKYKMYVAVPILVTIKSEIQDGKTITKVYLLNIHTYINIVGLKPFTLC